MDKKKYDEYVALAESYYREADPEADVSRGSVVHELVIRPAAYLFARHYEDLEAMASQYSLPLLAESPDPDETIAENLAANFRVERKEGTKGVGYVAVYSKSTDDLYIGMGTLMSAGGVELTTNVNYIGVADATDMEDTDTLAYREFRKVSEDEWAFTIEVETVDYTAATVAEGTLVVFDAPNHRVSRSEISSAVSGGSGEESIADMVARVAYGVTAKIPSGKAHITSLLESAGKSIIDLVVKGMGDPEMLRDRNNPLGISVGGRVDVWCRTARMPVTITARVPASKGPDGLWRAFVDSDIAPGWCDITAISHPDNPGVVTNSNEIDMFFGPAAEEGGPEVFDGPSARYSPYQTANITFEYPGLSGTTEEFIVSFRTQPGLEDIQGFLASPAVANPQQDTLVRGIVPADVGMELTAVNQGADVDSDAVAALVAEYINNLPSGTGSLSMADLSCVIGSAYPSLSLVFPVIMRVSAVMPDGSTWSMETSEGVLELPTEPIDGVTGSVMAFTCAKENVSVSVVRSL